MNFLYKFYKTNLSYDLINKFSYKHKQELPKLKKIVINIGCNTNNIKTLATNLLSLQLITNKKGKLTTTNKSNILLKIRKGDPVGCKIIIRKNSMFDFITKLSTEVIPKFKTFQGFKLNNKVLKPIFSFKIKSSINFSELEKHYYLFHKNNFPLTVTFVVNYQLKKELIFIIKSLEIPLKSKLHL